jgi:hypothetical protein
MPGHAMLLATAVVAALARTCTAGGEQCDVDVSS